MKRLLLAASALIFALIAAIAILVAAAPDRLKPLVVALVARDGRQTIALDGPIALSLLPRPVLRAENVTVSSRLGRIEAGRLVAHIAFRPLLSRRIVVERLDLDHAVWRPVAGDGVAGSGAAGDGLAALGAAIPAPGEEAQAEKPAAEGAARAAPSSRPPRHWRIGVLALRLTDAAIATPEAAPLSIIRLDLPAPPGPNASAFDLDARYAGLPFSISGMIARLPGDAVALTGVRVVAPEGDLALDGTLHLARRPSFAGKLTLHRLDLDALRHALPRRAPPPPPASAPAGGEASSPPPGWPRRALPFDLLRAVDLDLALAVGTLVESGAVYRDIALHVGLDDGRLVADPIHLVVPGGAVSGALRLDAAATPPQMMIHLLAPALALGPLAGAFHWPAENSGALEIFADLSAAGTTPQEIAATLDGRVGVAAVNAALENRLLLMALGKVLRRANLPAMGFDPRGRTDLRCLALRADITAGVAHLDPALAQMSRLDLGAAGTLDLGAGTMAVRLSPSLRIGANALVVPLRATGPLDGPALSPDPDQGDGALAQAACEPALLRARNGREGPAPLPAKPEKGLSLKDILRGLVK